MARWLLDEETGEYINADDLDPSQYEVVTPWGKIEDDVSQPREQVAPEPTPPEEEQSPYALLGIAPKAMSTVQKGVGSLYEGFNDIARWGADKVLGPAQPSDNPADFRSFLNSLFDAASEDNKGLIKQANERDQAVLDYYNVPPDSGTATAINIGGAAIPTIGMTALGAMYGLPAGLLATAPNVLPAAEKYQNLQDQGVDKSTAAGTAIANFGLQSLLNRADIMPLLSKDMSTLGKALGYSATNTAANEIGTIGEAALDSRVADRPWTNDQLSSAMTAAGLTGLASGPLVAPFTRARPEAAADMGPGMSSVDDMFQRMSAEGNDWEMTSPAPTAPQSLMIEGDARLGLPAPRPPLVPDGPKQLPAPPTRGALPAPETPQGLPLPEWMDPNAIQQPFTGEVPKQLPLPEWWDTLPKGDLTLDSDVPLLTPAQPQPDPLSQITPSQTKTPLIDVPNVMSPGRTPELDAELRGQTPERMRQLEDIFMPEDSEVAAFRQFTPEVSSPEPLLKNASWRGQLVKDLSPEERNIAGQIISASKGQKIPTTADVNPRQGEVTTSDVIVGSESESFPQPIAGKVTKPEMQTASEPVSVMPESLVEASVPGTPISEKPASNEGTPVTYVPTRSLSLSDDVPQWKRNANEKGVVKPLKGQYDDRGANPLQVYQRNDGRLEVVSGRHRLDLAQRVGKESLPAQIYREDAGYTPKDMALLDAELNIRDEHGEIGDYAFFFRNAKLSPAEAEARGLLSRAKGVMGFDIGTKSTPDLYSLFESGRIDDRKAAAIANFAPNDDFLQQIGIRSALEDEPISTIVDRMGWVSRERSSLPQGEQGDMFGGQLGAVDSGWQLVGEASAVARQMRRDVAEDIRAIQGASLRPERAAKQGVDMRDARAVQRRLQELKTQEEKLSEFWKHPELKAKIEAQAKENLLNPKSPVQPITSKDLPAPEDNVIAVRNKGSQRVANRYKRQVTSSEAGHTSLFTDLAYLVTKPFRKEDLPGGPIPESTLKEGGLLRKIPGWGRHAEWMSTTVKKNPEATPYVEAGYKIGQDANTMMWDASEMLQPFLEMDDSRAAPVQAYLYAKRYAANGKELKGARQANATPVSIDDAMRYGLDKEQAQAALAVSNWSKTWLETLKHDAIEDLKFKTQQTLSDPKVKSAPDKIKAIEDGYSKSVQQITERFNQMQQQNYVPLSRYGKYFVNLKDAQGNVIESLRFEKPSHPNYAKTVKHFDRLAKEQGGSLERGVDPDRLEFTTKDMPKDILELMGQEGSVSGFPGHLKPARLVPGFEWDLKRAVADYSTKGARFIAMRRAKRAWAQERATLLANPLNNSLVNKLESWSNNFDKVDGAFFNGINEAFNVAYIGGNLRTPTADIIGRMHLQYPLIQKYADPKMFGISGDVIWTKAIGKEFDWYLTKDATKKFDGKYDGLGSGIEEAQKKGIIQSRVQKHLLEMASGKDKGALGAVNNARKFYFGVKEMTERSNNLSSFIIGWDLYPQWAKRQPDGAQVPTRQAFAENFVREANPVPGMAELPPMFGKRTVRLVTKYKTYQGKLIKTLAENPNMRVWSRYLAAMMGTTGLMGLPFMRDAMNTARGSGVEPEEEIRKAGFGTGTLYGPLSAAAGIDLSGTAGFGEVLPGVNQGGLTKAMLGVLGAPIASVERASDLFSRDQTLKGIAALPFVPNPIANALNVSDWATYGARTKGGDVLIQRDDVTGTDMLKKLLGYQPMSLKEAYAKYNIKSGELARSRDNDNINQRIGQAKAIDDYATVNTLREEARSKGIKINDKQVKKYEMAIREGQSLLEANAPKKMKQRLKEIDRLFD